MFLIFGLILVVRAVQLFRHRDVDPDVQDNRLVRVARRALTVTPDYVGGRLFTRIAGRRAVTPLFIVLLAIGSTDLLFALDSIPEISTNLSLIVIALVLTFTTIASLVKVRLDPTARAYAGSLTAENPSDAPPPRSSPSDQSREE